MPTTPATSSADAPSTSDHADSSAAPATAPTTTSTTPWTRALQHIDLETLSTRSKAIRIAIGDQIPDGYKLTEIANELGVSPSWVSARLDELRTEILLQQGRFLPLTDNEYAALEASILEHGQQVPILIGETGLVDGLHRCQILLKHGHTEALAVFLIGYTPDQERDIGVTVNTARRMLTRAHKEALIRHELETDWNRSSRSIATLCGVNHETVEAVRTRIRTERTLAAQPDTDLEQLPDPTTETRLSRTGTPMTAYVHGRGSPPAPAKTLADLACPSCGATHTLTKNADGYALQATP